MSLIVGGCTSTVAPKPVVSHQPAFSGNSTNSGFVGFAAGGGGIITGEARDKYNGLIGIYGKKFVPPLTKDFGITASTNGNYLITDEALSDFAVMNHWQKDDFKP